ncbi:hypothetical protein [Planococcus versutus]|uniref:Uncharacterized protein n=1 Tax=Planococcus versutus TaxID=1302659 RepID=A0A1B1RY08_9BACL|nr:hypothetical protein [Planococcus versutus]ANU25804.1 hypothetical protein I858_001770 [Planococcus versutus]
MRNFYVILISIFLLGTVFCVFGQGLAYFLSEYFVMIYPVYYLTGLTVLGIFLYLVAGFLVFLLFKKQEFASNNREFYLLILFTVAPSATIWSFFVTVMWWG